MAREKIQETAENFTYHESTPVLPMRLLTATNLQLFAGLQKNLKVWSVIFNDMSKFLIFF